MAFQPKELHPERSARDRLGAEIRKHRERQGLSLSQLAAILAYSKSQLSRVENGEVVPPVSVINALDLLFDTGQYFQGLYKAAKAERHPGKYKEAMDLEARATVIEEYSCQNVPGLLQTPDVAFRLLRAGLPHAPLSEIEQSRDLRIQRQDRLRKPAGPRCSFILDEAVIRRPIGDARLMAAQLAHIIKAAEELSTVTVQVLPFSSGEHAEMGGSLTLFTLPRRTHSQQFACLEGNRVGTVFDDPEFVAALRESYDLLRAQALSPRDSLAMIGAAMKEYEQHVI
jgi:transcriptional regulator with XRE-family HTH domain